MEQRRVGAAVVLGASALLLLPAVASAQMRFGVGGYGGYYGYSPGLYNYSYSPGWNYYSPGVSTYGGYAYPGYGWRSGGYFGGYNYPSYGTSYPSYGATDFYYNTPDTSSYYGSGYAGDVGSTYQYGTRSGAGARDAALLNVRVPDANAEVWVEGQQTRQRGTWREFESPPLNSDKSYTYEVRARWTENGKTVERTRTVPVKANGVATADFTAPANNSRVDEIDRERRGPDKDRTNPGTDTNPKRNPATDTNPRPGSGTRPPDTRPPDQP